MTNGGFLLHRVHDSRKLFVLVTFYHYKQKLLYKINNDNKNLYEVHGLAPPTTRLLLLLWLLPTDEKQTLCELRFMHSFRYFMHPIELFSII